MDRYDVRYFRCSVCGFTQTEEPYWLAEAYSSAIVRSDIGLPKRNLEMARVTQSMVRAFFDASSRFIDYGAGYGLFVRLMRDAGYDFRWFDRYAENLFAPGLEVQQGTSDRFELLTAFEVFEHLASPAQGIEEMLRFSDSILFSTLLMPRGAPLPGEWWYYGLGAGQHLALYSRDSLEHLASRFGLRLYSNGHSLHLMTRRRIWARGFRIVSRIRVARLLSAITRRRTLTNGDYEVATRLPGTRQSAFR